MKIYVNAHFSGAASGGTQEAPFRRINDAAKIAQPGDEIIVAPGIYREYIDPVNSGTEAQRIVYRSEQPLAAVITGAEPLTGWEKYEGSTWVTRVSNDIFGDYNPYIQLVEGDWYMGPSVFHTGDVYLNGQSLYESRSLEECIAGEVYPFSWEPEKSKLQWFTAQDDGQTVIYANFQGKNPNEENVEFNVRRRCIFPTREGRNYITVSGFTVTKAATTWAPPSCHQDGMIGVNWSKGWIIEDCEISGSKCCGISLGRNYDPDNEQYFFHRQIKSANQMGRESICRALSQGWYKENIGSHIVRRCHIHHCEQAGIIGRQGCIFSTIEDNHVHHINLMQQLLGAEVAGIKLHVPIDTVIRRNHIHHCSMGLWLDWVAQGTRVSANLLHDNQLPEGLDKSRQRFMSQDIFMEASLGPTLIDNNLLLSDVSIRFAAQGVACVHNLICGSFTSVGDGTDQIANGINQPRYFSYHYPHRTELIGFKSCLHGDNRFYNNLYVQRWPIRKADAKEEMGFFFSENSHVGNFVWDDYPSYDTWISNFDLTHKPSMEDMTRLTDMHYAHLPVWINGNAYLHGAAAYHAEENKLVCEKGGNVRLLERDGGYYLESDLAECLGDFTCAAVSSDLLGKAFEPEERFENPDGSDIDFRPDYLGIPRTKILPGPFAALTSSIRVG